GGSRFYNAAQNIAFRVLQETLIGCSGSSSPSSTNKGHNSSLPSDSSLLLNQRHENNLQTTTHFRSKSRSQFYHKDGAERNDLGLKAKKVDLRIDETDRED